jgi:hypothetical protein
MRGVFDPLGDRAGLHEKTTADLFAGLREQRLSPARSSRTRFRDWMRSGRNPA